MSCGYLHRQCWNYFNMWMALRPVASSCIKLFQKADHQTNWIILGNCVKTLFFRLRLLCCIYAAMFSIIKRCSCCSTPRGYIRLLLVHLKDKDTKERKAQRMKGGRVQPRRHQQSKTSGWKWSHLYWACSKEVRGHITADSTGNRSDEMWRIFRS